MCGFVNFTQQSTSTPSSDQLNVTATLPRYQCRSPHVHICCMTLFIERRLYYVLIIPIWSKREPMSPVNPIGRNRHLSGYIHVGPKIKWYLQNAHVWSAKVNWLHRTNWSSTFMTSHNNHVLCSAHCLLWFWISRVALYWAMASI